MRLTTFCCVLLLGSIVGAQQSNSKAVMTSVQAGHDVQLTTDPSSPFWREVHPVYAGVDPQGTPEPEYQTEVRSRWTKDNLYFLFVCPYKQLYLKPKPDVEHETFQLWNWNVAEVFIGSDFQNIRRYKEFEISPQGEWVDLDIDLDKPHHEDGWLWNSGFEHAARIDESRHIWYAALRIPLVALGGGKPAAGGTFRVNLFRTEGPPKAQKEIVWQPTMSETFHVPERFGLLKLEAR